MSSAFRAVSLGLGVLLLLGLGAVVAVFLLRNDHDVLIRFPELAEEFSWATPFHVADWDAPLWAIICGSFVAGATAVTVFVWLPSVFRRKASQRRDRRFIGALEGELTDLREMLTAESPLTDLPDPIPTGEVRVAAPELDPDPSEALTLRDPSK